MTFDSRASEIDVKGCQLILANINPFPPLFNFDILAYSKGLTSLSFRAGISEGQSGFSQILPPAFRKFEFRRMWKAAKSGMQTVGRTAHPAKRLK